MESVYVAGDKLSQEDRQSDDTDDGEAPLLVQKLNIRRVVHEHFRNRRYPLIQNKKHWS